MICQIKEKDTSFQRQNEEKEEEDELDIISQKEANEKQSLKSEEDNQIINPNEDDLLLLSESINQWGKTPNEQRQRNKAFTNPQRITTSHSKSRLNTIYTISSSKKTIFSIITEKAYAQCLESSLSKPSFFNDLVDEQRIGKELERRESNKSTIANMLQRQKEHSEKARITLKREKERYDSRITDKCIWVPIRHNEEYQYSLPKTKEHLNHNLKEKKMLSQLEKNDKVNKTQLKPQIAKPLKLLSTKQTDQEVNAVWSRLNNKSKHNDRDNNRKTKDISKRIITKAEDKLLIERLSKSNSKKTPNTPDGTKSSQCYSLLSLSTKKLLLEKFICLFNKSMMTLFNKSDNTCLSFEELQSLMMDLGCVDKSKEDASLIRLAFKRFLHSTNDKTESNWVLLFCLCWLGVYTNNSEENSLLMRKQLAPIKHELYNYDSTTIQRIKATYPQFNSALISKWKKQSSEKRQLLATLHLPLNHSESNSKSTANVNKVPSKSKQKTSTPEINNDTHPIEKKLIPHGLYRLRKQKELTLLLNQKEDELKRECTFQPNPSKKTSKSIKSNYYLLKKQNKKKVNEDVSTDTKEDISRAFTPSIHRIDKSLFVVNPLQDDKQLHAALLKLETYKMNKKKSNSSLTTQGKTNEQPSMHFHLEKKTHKDVFSK